MSIREVQTNQPSKNNQYSEKELSDQDQKIQTVQTNHLIALKTLKQIEAELQQTQRITNRASSLLKNSKQLKPGQADQLLAQTKQNVNQLFGMWDQFVKTVGSGVAEKKSNRLNLEEESIESEDS